MNASRTRRIIVWLLSAGGMSLGAPLTVGATEGSIGITAVASKASKDYVRTRLPDGSFRPEEYAFGEGGRVEGPFRDASIDKLSFLDIARALAGPLRGQNYIPTRDLNAEELLIMVYWGTTTVPDQLNLSVGYMNRSGSLMYLDNVQRDLLDSKNAKILGYNFEKPIESDFGNFTTATGPSGLLQDELLSEIEDNRYYVVLLAYDFQLFRTKNRHKLLWETRFSINELHNHFDKALPVMAQYASAYFGQDSHGLLRRRVPEGHVEVGEPKSLGPLPEK
jgi:hypothetical protein